MMTGISLLKECLISIMNSIRQALTYQSAVGCEVLLTMTQE